MADDHNQRAYRGGDLSSRGAAAGNGSSGNDPLAELARLIGQTDPFAEYGRNSANRTATVPGQQQAAPTAWPEETAAYPAEQSALPEPHAYADRAYGNGGFSRQSYGSAPLSGDSAELYPVDAHAPGYAPQGYEADPYANGPTGSYDQAFPPSQEPLHDVHQQFGPAATDDYYDDVASNRRRISVLAIAGVFALAVLGTAGALGYRAVFGPSSAPTTPPVIKAEATPSKVVPATSNKEAGKSITDRVGGTGQIERLLSREEQPVPVTTTPNPSAASAAPAMGSGIVGEPRKIRTIQIRPDQAGDAASAAPAAPEPMPSAAQPPVRVVNTAPAAEPPPARVMAQPEPRPAPQPARNVTPQAAAPVQAAPPPPAQPSNAPLSLNPNAQPARAAAPARVAAQTPAPAPQTAAATAGGYAVQVSAQRSEGEAQAAFQALQGKFPNQLGGRAPFIKRVDLGDKGIYYRAMVAVGSSGEASELCSSLKAAGGQCIVQRN
ncbi:SPOR domain-containing protein [Undibacter mobilis]|uniref:SPOR domain-containing protein n=1 Tax=Undibacter mobilis TaxID=2292256 RepID=A0A371B0H8_9BRAD|nr:SPOR domain-containing protein [Undibacter mobilis]RDV01076.1 SPOR domain-containing protein [Undibacter mobilis]